jgi:hypothetical protein
MARADTVRTEGQREKSFMEKSVLVAKDSAQTAAKHDAAMSTLFGELLALWMSWAAHLAK